jgi:hypothetical protein
MPHLLCGSNESGPLEDQIDEEDEMAIRTIANPWNGIDAQGSVQAVESRLRCCVPEPAA